MTTWDEHKRLKNLANQGVDFRNFDALQWERALVFEDRPRDYGETRLIALASLRSRLHVVVYFERGGERCIISARKANSREVAIYETEATPPES